MQRRLGALVLLTGFIVSVAAPAAAQDPSGNPDGPGPAVAHEPPEPPDHPGDRWSPGNADLEIPPDVQVEEPTSVIVELGPGAASAASTARAVGGEVIGTIPHTGSVVIALEGRDASAVAEELEARPGVVSAEPNGVMHAYGVPNDPVYGFQEPSFDEIRLEEAWDLETGASHVVVAVLDSGVDPDHPDLVGRLVAGRNVLADNAATADDFGHGTMVAGIIGATRGNGVGVAGVAGGGVKIMPVKVLNSVGNGTDADVIDGIVWAADHGADVINLSLGRLGSSVAVANAVGYANAKGVVVVAATGNDEVRAPSTPAGEPGVIGVAATDADGHFAYFSTYGTQVDLAAPGMAIASTTDGGGYGAGDGTSFAAPMVSGVAALLRSRNPGYGEERIRVELTRTAEDRGSPGIDDSYGFGLLDAAAALGVRGREPILGVAAAANDTEPNDVPNRATAATATNTGDLNVEGDVDWWRINVAAAASVTITLTPTGLVEDRAANFDPVMAVHRPDLSLVQRVDDAGTGAPEAITFSAQPGIHLIGVSNYHGSTSAGPYQLTIAPAPAPVAPAAPGVSATGPWLVNSTPAARTTVAPPGSISVTFGRPVDISSVDEGTFILFDGLTGYSYPADVSFNTTTSTATLVPQIPIPRGSPLLVGIGGVVQAVSGSTMPATYIPFTTTGKAFTPPVLGWDFTVLAGDFNGDGPTDAFLYQAGGDPDFTLLGSWEGFYGFNESVTGSYEPFTVDLDGDGYKDIVWYRPGTGADFIWYGKANGFTTEPTTINGVYEPFALDFNGDGYEDIIWYKPGTGADFIWYGKAGGFTSKPTTINGIYEPFALDLNGDGYDDIVWYKPGTGADFIWYGKASGFSGAPTTINGVYDAIPGDFNGDGFDDITWYKAGTGQDWVWWGRANGFAGAPVTINGTYRPSAGDFNGDLFDDILFYGVSGAPDTIAFGGLQGHLP